jgi:hypothetical protein
MKKIKMAVMAIAAISSVGSAFAFSSAPKRAATTYYAIPNPNGEGFVWTTLQPSPNEATCQPAATGVCTIVTSTAPTDNVVPAAHASEPKSQYLPI